MEPAIGISEEQQDAGAHLDAAAIAEQVCRDFVDDVWCRGNADHVRKYMAPDARIHRFGLPPGDPVAAYAAYVGAVHRAFPDLRIEVAEVIAGPDRAACRYHVRGTHQDEFIGIEATGKEIEFIGLSMVHIENGKIIEEWTEDDAIAIFNQLGVLGVEVDI